MDNIQNLKSNIKIKHNMKKMFLHLSKFRCFKKNRMVSLRVMLLVLLNLITIHVWSQSEPIYVFSVSSTKRVIFSPGNLQYHRYDKVWSFASQQYEIIGTNNSTGGTVTYSQGSGYENTTATKADSLIDLFGWSATNATGSKYGVGRSNDNANFQGDFNDWGKNKISGYPANTWRTLTKNEWNYLRFTRTNADKLVGVARLKIAGVIRGHKNGGFVNGVIFLPDNWICPEGVTFKPGFHENTGTDTYAEHQTFTKTQWKKLEAAGAVFLPAAGFRDGHHMHNVQYGNGYWSATPSGTDKAAHLSFNSKSVGVNASNERWAGRAVRLVKNFTPILVNDDDPKVTSTAGKTITKYVSITILDYVDKTTITGTSNNPAFEVVSLTKAPGTYNLVVSYTPTATTDGTETATITLKSSAGGETTKFTITGRHLPAKFAVISKMGNQWYALSSETMEKGSPAVLVSVNDNTNPTQVTMGPKNIGWSLEQPIVGDNHSPIDRILLTNSDGNCLRAKSDGISLRTDRTPSASTYADWHPTTEDLIEYTLTNPKLEKLLSLSRQKTFGTFDDYVSDVVRFVAIKATYEQADLRVVEWYPTKVLLYSNESQYVKSATVYIDDAKQTSAKVAIVGRNLLEITGLNFVDTITINAGKRLSVRYTKDGKTYGQTITIPIILSGSLSLLKNYDAYTTGSAHLNGQKRTDKNRQYLDVVVRDKATLSINSSVLYRNTFCNVYIHPSGRIVVGADCTFGINSLTFWGGIDDIYDGSTYSEYKYEVPKLLFREGATLQKTKAAIDYIMRVDLEQMYSLALPYDVAFADITYWDGEAMTPGTQLYVSTYDGQARANLDMENTWLYETEFPTKKLTAGAGYTISAEPQADANSTLPEDSYALIRMPMKNNLTAEGTEQDKTVAVTAYANQSGVTISDNHKGWNLVGNPFMCDISSDMNGDQIVLGWLKETGQGPYEWVNDGVRYVTIPNDDGTYYWQEQFKNVTLKPFKNFFVQIAKTGELSFALSCRKNAPARYLLNDMEQETEFEILLSNDTQSDHTGVLLSEQYTPAYEINADLEKMFGQMSVYSIYGGHSLAYNALSWTDAEQQIPLGYHLPETGEYRFSIRENASVDGIQHIYLTDNDESIVVDLLDGAYSFMSQVTENEGRFSIQVIRSSEINDTTTDIDNIDVHNDCPQKIYYQGQLFIMHKGKIYNTLGQKITK